MTSIAAPSQSYVKTREQLVQSRQKLIDLAVLQYRRNSPEWSQTMDEVLNLDLQLLSPVAGATTPQVSA